MGKRFYIEADGLTITDKEDEYYYVIENFDDAVALCTLLNDFDTENKLLKGNIMKKEEIREIRWIRANDYLTKIKGDG